MFQYEMVWKSKDGNYFERYVDLKTNKVHIKPFNPKYEYFIQTKEPSKYKFILDESINLKKVSFEKSSEFYKSLKENEVIGKTIYGISKPVYSYIKEKYFENGLEFKSRVWHLDIEAVPPIGGEFPNPTEAQYPINSIQIYDNILDKKIILVSKPLNNPEEFSKKYPNTLIKNCKTEEGIFKTFFEMIQKFKPAIITAWNGNFFDFPYITNRAKKIGVNYRKLSPIMVISEKNTFEGKVPVWEGIYLIDLMEAYKSFTYETQVSYSLDNIAKVELGEEFGKIDYGEFNGISEFFIGNYDKFIEYADMDIEIMKRLDNKLNLIEIIRKISYMMGINYDDAFGTVKPWGVYLTNYAYKRNLILPKDTKHELEKGIVGGFVAEPQKGLHKWVISIDVNSMYPLLGMKAFNMSPETFIQDKNLTPELRHLKEKYQKDEDETKFLNKEVLDEIEKICKKHNVSFGINAFFKRDKTGIIPEIITNIYTSRKKAKNIMLKYSALNTKLKDFLRENNTFETQQTSNFDWTLENIENNKCSFEDIRKADLNFLSETKIKELIKKSEFKASLWNATQMALKILMNSLYGALSNTYFILFNRDIASSITGNGRTYIRGMSLYVNKELNKLLKNDKEIDYCVYNDTDSAYFEIDKIVEKILKSKFNTNNYYNLPIEDKEKFLNYLLLFIEKHINKYVDEYTNYFANKFNSYAPEAIGAKLEKISDKGLFVAKKKYALRVIYNEGDILIKNPKLAVTGLEIIRSSTPQFCRRYLKDAIELIMDNTELEIQDYIKDIKEKFFNADVTEISRVSGVSNLDYQLMDGKYKRLNNNGNYIPAPINSRASLLHNELIKRLNLHTKYPLITENNKIKYVYLKVPNIINNDVIGYLDSEFLYDTKLIKDLDLELMFKKFFISPIQIMLDVVGYEAERKTTVSDWF